MSDLVRIRYNLLQEKIERGQQTIEIIQEIYDNQLRAAQQYVYKCQVELEELRERNPQLKERVENAS